MFFVDRGQCCDGASSMSGKYNGLAAKVQKELEARAVYVCAVLWALYKSGSEGLVL